jgi:hypothetical protein
MLLSCFLPVVRSKGTDTHASAAGAEIATWGHIRIVLQVVTTFAKFLFSPVVLPMVGAGGWL